jgi:hypothetical protein
MRLENRFLVPLAIGCNEPLFGAERGQDLLDEERVAVGQGENGVQQCRRSG